MQDRYAGDIGDYGKFGLLRILAENRRLGVAWYQYPNEVKTGDGKHTNYLDDAAKWRGSDPKLFDALRSIVFGGKRNLLSLQESFLIKDAAFSSNTLKSDEAKFSARESWRKSWFERVISDLNECDVVFADPDNGLCEDSRYRYGTVKHWKRIPLAEVHALAKDRTAVIYHHNTRRKGGNEKEIADWIDRIGKNTFAVRWRAYSGRTFFVVNPRTGMRDQAKQFVRNFGEKAEFFTL
jgi:hypothetical protein